MNTMTIHADDVYAAALRAYAEKIGKSISQTIQLITAPTLGLVHGRREAKNPYLAFCGVLPKAGRDEMNNRLASQRTIDAEMWK